MKKGENKAQKIQRNAELHQNVCMICDDPAEQIVILLNQLKNRLTLKIKYSSEEYEETDERTYISPLSVFSSLLNIILGDKIFLKEASEVCSHEKLFSDFKKKLRCTQKALKEACKMLSYEIGGRNYHFQLLNQQISSVLTRTERKLYGGRKADDFKNKSYCKLKKKNSFSLKQFKKVNSQQKLFISQQKQFKQEQNKNINSSQQNLPQIISGFTYNYIPIPVVYSSNQSKL